MPACAKNGSKCSGHGGFNSRANDPGSCSTTVFVNGEGILRKDDTYPTHSSGTDNHTSKIEAGSSTVKADTNRDVARIGDHLIKLAGTGNCQSSIAQGSGNVFVGG